MIVIEHNLEVIKTADWIIDMGPEGGNGGGQVVAQGTPEDVAKVEASYTGRYLKDYLKPPAQRETVAAKKTGNGKRRHAAAGFIQANGEIGRPAGRGKGCQN